MRRQHDVGEGREPWVDPGLVLEDVDPGAGDPALLERAHERGLVDDRPPRRVDEERRLLHEPEGALVDEVPGLRQERRVQADEVGLAEDRLRLRVRDAQLPLRPGRPTYRALVEDPQDESPGPPPGGPADPPEAQDADL